MRKERRQKPEPFFKTSGIFYRLCKSNSTDETHCVVAVFVRFPPYFINRNDARMLKLPSDTCLSQKARLVGTHLVKRKYPTIFPAADKFLQSYFAPYRMVESNHYLTYAAAPYLLFYIIFPAG